MSSIEVDGFIISSNPDVYSENTTSSLVTLKKSGNASLSLRSDYIQFPADSAVLELHYPVYAETTDIRMTSAVDLDNEELPNNSLQITSSSTQKARYLLSRRYH